MKGVWVLHHKERDTRSVLLIDKDTISIPNYYTIQTKLSVSLEITDDSLNIPNPCTKERCSYQLINDTFYVNSTYLIYQPKKISSNLLLYNTQLTISLAEVPTQHSKIDIEHYSIYIGKERDSTQTSFPRFFSDGYCLKINENICDSIRFESWLNQIEAMPDEVLTIVLYRDKHFSTEKYIIFLAKLYDHLGKKAMVYEACFDENIEGYLGINRVFQ